MAAGARQFMALPNLTHLEWQREPGLNACFGGSLSHLQLTGSHRGWGTLLYHLMSKGPDPARPPPLPAVFENVTCGSSA